MCVEGFVLKSFSTKRKRDRGGVAQTFMDSGMTRQTLCPECFCEPPATNLLGSQTHLCHRGKSIFLLSSARLGVLAGWPACCMAGLLAGALLGWLLGGRFLNFSVCPKTALPCSRPW